MTIFIKMKTYTQIPAGVRKGLCTKSSAAPDGTPPVFAPQIPLLNNVSLLLNIFIVTSGLISGSGGHSLANYFVITN